MIDLETDASVADVLGALADEPGLACLWGEGWGSTLITSRPVEVSAEVAALDELAHGLAWLGWLGYDRPHHLALHDHLLRQVDGRWRIELLWTPERAVELEAAEARYRDAVATNRALSWTVGEFAGADRGDHLRAVEEAIGLIRGGELYQVNVCTRLGANFTGSAVALFAAAVERLRPAFGAYLTAGPTAVASVSPELFLRRTGRDVRSSPIKGTRPRDDTTAGARELRLSAKDVAENVMIVDLVRNDFGRVSEPGSVRASELLEIQPHPGVWHLVSTVAATLRADVTDSELIAAAFPPGSVTGAPKLRALDAIAALEAVPRGIYTGAIGIATRDELALSVAIRTFEIAEGRAELGVGGGVTVDSVPMMEWHETRHKATPLIEAIGGTLAQSPSPESALAAGGLLETMLAVNGRTLRLADHLGRLDLSCRELYGRALPASAEGLVRAAAVGRRRAIRLTVTPSVECVVTSSEAPDPIVSLSLRAVRRPGLWRHKWADRSWITDSDALFLGADGSVLETTFGNVFLLGADGRVVTPPLRDDLLPGVTRRGLLDVLRDDGCPVELRSFDLGELATAAAVVSTSSLSGIVTIDRVDGAPMGRLDQRVAELNARLGFGPGSRQDR